MRLLPLALLILSPPCLVLAGSPAPKAPSPAPIAPTIDPWEVTLSLPGWLSGMDGTVGVNGFTTEVSPGFTDILPHVDMIAAATLEVQRGRWGGWIDGLYLKASIEGDTPGPVLNSLGVTIEQVILEAAVFYRAWQSDRGFLDLYAGARYMSVGSEMSFDVSNSGAEQVAEQLSHQVVNQVASAVKNEADAALASARGKIADHVSTAARAGIASTVSTKAAEARTALASLQQIAAAHPRLADALRNSSRLKSAIRSVADARIDEKLAAAQTAAASASTASAAVKAAAQEAAAKAASSARKAVSRAEKKLAEQVEDALLDAIPSEISGSVDWVDPFIGMRASYNLTDRLYALAKADIGGFGVSSDLVWSAYGALGYRVTQSGKTTVELGYKHMAVDYTTGGSVFDVALSGIMLNMSVKF